MTDKQPEHIPVFGGGLIRAMLPAGPVAGDPLTVEGDAGQKLKVGTILSVKPGAVEGTVEAVAEVFDPEVMSRIQNGVHDRVSVGTDDEDEDLPWAEAEAMFNQLGSPGRRLIQDAPHRFEDVLNDRRSFQQLKEALFEGLTFDSEEAALAFFAGFHTGNDLAKVRMRGVNARALVKDRTRVRTWLWKALKPLLADHPKALAAVSAVLRTQDQDPDLGEPL